MSVVIIGFFGLLIVYLVSKIVVDSKYEKDTSLEKLVLFAVVVVGFFLNCYTADVKIEERKIPIYSIGLNKASNFCLGKNGEKYLYYIGDSIGGFELRSVLANSAVVKYTNDKPFILFKDAITTFCIGGAIRSVESIELYLPNGAIVQDYKIDL